MSLLSAAKLRHSELQSFELDVPFRGKRAYLHFPDVYDELMLQLRRLHGHAELTEIRMGFHRELSTQPLFVYGPAEGFGPSKAPALVLSLMVAGKPWTGALYETTSPVLRRLPDSQSEVAENVRIEGDKVTLSQPTGRPVMEELITMGKEYFKRRFSCEQFRFAKIVLSRPIETADSGKLILDFRPRAQRAFLKASILLGTETLGHCLGCALI